MTSRPSPPDFSPSAGQGNGSPRFGFVQIPGYEIEREIGRGGMATVYRAVQHSLGRPVAIKVLARGPDDQDEFAQRFKKEGRILAQLLHPNIVTIYDIGVSEDNQLFLSMENIFPAARFGTGSSWACPSIPRSTLSNPSRKRSATPMKRV